MNFRKLVEGFPSYPPSIDDELALKAIITMAACAQLPQNVETRSISHANINNNRVELRHYDGMPRLLTVQRPQGVQHQTIVEEIGLGLEIGWGTTLTGIIGSTADYAGKPHIIDTQPIEHLHGKVSADGDEHIISEGDFARLTEDSYIKQYLQRIKEYKEGELYKTTVLLGEFIVTTLLDGSFRRRYARKLEAKGVIFNNANQETEPKLSLNVSFYTPDEGHLPPQEERELKELFTERLRWLGLLSVQSDFSQSVFATRIQQVFDRTCT